MRFFSLLFAMIIWAGMVNAQSAGKEQTLPDTFDLFIYGDHLQTNPLTIAVRTNPEYGSKWDTVSITATLQPDRHHLLYIKGLSTARYFGQDIRQNYVAAKIEPFVSSSTAKVRAIYCMPSAAVSVADLSNIRQLFNNQPLKAQQWSLAHYVTPSPRPLSQEPPFITPIEAPVRHKTPGVLEVQWIEKLYQLN